MSVLQALQYIKDHVDGTLSFRWSCRMAICGSCGMMIDGKPQLACQTILRAGDDRPLRIEPLKHFPIERDLVVTVSGFVSKSKASFLSSSRNTPRTTARESICRRRAKLARFENFSDCINCMLCYAACPQFGENPDFLGPGVLALLQRYNGDSRDGGQAKRMELVHSENGAWSCTAVGYCSECLPEARRSGQCGQPEQDQQRRWTSSSGSCRDAANPPEVCDASLPTCVRSIHIGGPSRPISPTRCAKRPALQSPRMPLCCWPA